METNGPITKRNRATIKQSRVTLSNRLAEGANAFPIRLTMTIAVAGALLAVPAMASATPRDVGVNLP